MEDKTQRTKKNYGPWFYIGETVALGVIIGLALLFLEYYVFNPGDEPSQLARGERLRALVPWGVGIVLAIVLITSVARRDGRTWWLGVGRWLRGLRPQLPLTTANQRTAHAQRLYEEGFDARSAEVDRERAEADKRPPSWRIERRSENHPDEFILYNSGWMVGNVHINAPENYFTFDGGAPVFPGDFGDNSAGGAIGKRFYGTPSDEAVAEGMTFTVSWTDVKGYRHEQAVFVDPSNLNSGVS
ncbi:hypothetical protein ACIPY2_19880 [Paenarthrobacter sp. NPDC089675]|uniref:hypothetical protein n=1 Tax=Paenarthrobacter TaxID=1742992 RepID=UPI00382991A9